MVSISIDIDNQVKEHFNQFVKNHGSVINDSDIKHAKEKIAEIRASDSDGYIIEQTSSLESMIAMISDKTWESDKENLKKINATIKYFVDDEDIIPDHIPGIGYLDDCIIIDNTMDDVSDELDEYKDFCRTRLVYAKGEKFTFDDWSKIKNQEAVSRVRNRRLRRSKKF
ncbi:MAG: DUF1232 domain-containing protein [Xanthomonadales bacterium]|nr:DUF1232 domain-containing protein [Xanthomonadales bacterium]